MVEYDFSPPERPCVLRPFALRRVSSGSTCERESVGNGSNSNTAGREASHLKVQFPFLMIGKELAAESTLTELVEELDSSVGRDVLLEFLPPLTAVD